MKISPLIQGGGSPGQTLGSVDVGRTATPDKLARAKAIAAGHIVEEEKVENIEQPRPNVRTIKMNTQRSTDREEMPIEQVAAPTELTQESSAPVTNEAVTEETKPLSPQFAALAKQKRALQLERAQFEKDKAAAASVQPQGQNDLVERLKSQPLSVLQEHGISYDQLTEALLASNDGSSQKLREFEAKLAALEQGFEQKLSARDAQAEEAALTEMLHEAEALAKDGESYEMVRENNAYDTVLRRIYDHFKKTGQILGVSEVMDKVESELLDKALKFAKLKKVQGKLVPEAPAQPLQPQQQQMRTLTNRDGATTLMSRRQRAIAAANGTLKR